MNFLSRLSAGLCSLMLVAGMAVLSGCSSTPDAEDRTPTEKLYAEAKDELAAGSYDLAIKRLTLLEGRAVGTVLAQQVLLDLAWAQWKVDERVQAVSTLDRFVKLHPSSPAMDYALYLRGLVNFNDGMGFLSSISRQDMSERDQQASRDAYQSFRQVVERFPDSRYADDARLRMDYIVNALAEYEVHVSRYYYRRAAYVAAANRAQNAVRDFPRAPATEEALYIMAESYDRLGLSTLSDDAERVLKRNFPESRYLRDGVRVRDSAWWQFW